MQRFSILVNFILVIYEHKNIHIGVTWALAPTHIGKGYLRIPSGSSSSAQYVYINTHDYVYIHIYSYIYTYIHIYSNMHTYTRICIPTHIYMYIHIYTYTYKMRPNIHTNRQEGIQDFRRAATAAHRLRRGALEGRRPETCPFASLQTLVCCSGCSVLQGEF